MVNREIEVKFGKLGDEAPHIGGNYYIQVIEYKGLFDFNERQMDEIKPMIEERDRIGLHNWFKENTKDFFNKCISDRDPDRIVSKIMNAIHDDLRNE